MQKTEFILPGFSNSTLSFFMFPPSVVSWFQWHPCFIQQSYERIQKVLSKSFAIDFCNLHKAAFFVIVVVVILQSFHFQRCLISGNNKERRKKKNFHLALFLHRNQQKFVPMLFIFMWKLNKKQENVSA